MKSIIFSVILFVCTSANLFAQKQLPTLSEQDKKDAVENIARLVKAEYVYPETGEKVSKEILENLANGKYNAITDPMQFSEMITGELQTLSGDKHFMVAFGPDFVQQLKATTSKKQEMEMAKRKKAEYAKQNFGFMDVEILDGNIGYVNITGFCPLDMAKETAVSAMKFLANTDAVIVDFRDNNGGNISMPPFLLSYFVDEKPQVFSIYYDSKNKVTGKDKNEVTVEGRRLSDKPVYILTSNRTFSGAESFAYALQNRKRAIVIGETTGGGANVVQPRIINTDFVMRLPVIRNIDPLTNSNWEGKGIIPDVVTNAEKAKETAHIKALETLGLKMNNVEMKGKAEIMKARMNPVKVNEEMLRSYAGKYGVRRLLYEDGSLMYQKEGQPKLKLIATGPDSFVFENMNDLRIEMMVENNRVIGFKRIFINGETKPDKRD